MSNENKNNRNVFRLNRYPKIFSPYLPNLHKKTSLILRNYNILIFPTNNLNHNFIVKGKYKNVKVESTNTVYKLKCKNCSAFYVE